jgi:hypothetical protein
MLYLQLKTVFKDRLREDVVVDGLAWLRVVET